MNNRVYVLKAISDMSSETKTPEKSTQEILNELQKTHQRNTKTVADLKDQLLDAQAQLYKSHVALASMTEQLLCNVIETEREKLKQIQTATPAPVTTPTPTITPIVEESKTQT